MVCELSTRTSRVELRHLLPGRTVHTPLDEKGPTGPPSLCLITCYFGEAPRWIRIYLHTARHNPDIHFVLFTDCIPESEAQPNIQIIPATLGDICKRASDRLDLPIQFKEAFKLNDLRPAFGVIFEDYLGDFDAWGYVEVDMIYGQIRSFITPELLQEYDVITTRPEYITGHFTLFRNSPAVNTLFERCPDYPFVFITPKHYSFSECNFAWRHLLDGYPLDTALVEVESITHVVRRAADEGRIQAYFPHLVRERMDLHRKHWLLHWKEGRLFDLHGDEEILYFHFHFHKYEPHFTIPQWKDMPDSFYIHENGFFL